MTRMPGTRGITSGSATVTSPPPKVVAVVNARARCWRRPGSISCFAAGTPVRTLDGPRPIESIRTGDQVLSRDVMTGALAFRPVLAVHHNPPDKTLRVALDNGDAVVASRFHRFWLAGRGWAMARDLKPGEVLRTLDGPARITSVEQAPVQPVFNLDVAEFRTYFVGDSAMLVHDNTLPPPAPGVAAVRPHRGAGGSGSVMAPRPGASATSLSNRVKMSSMPSACIFHDSAEYPPESTIATGIVRSRIMLTDQEVPLREVAHRQPKTGQWIVDERVGAGVVDHEIGPDGIEGHGQGNTDKVKILAARRAHGQGQAIVLRFLADGKRSSW